MSFIYSLNFIRNAFFTGLAKIFCLLGINSVRKIE